MRNFLVRHDYRKAEVRFLNDTYDPKTKQFHEWALPEGAKPHGLLVDKQGVVFYTGNGNGTIGRLEPTTGKIT